MINKGNYWIFMITIQHVIRDCERCSLWDSVSQKNMLNSLFV